MSQALKGKVALVAGATRGAGRGIAVNLVRPERLSMLPGVRPDPTIGNNRPETIEETAELSWMGPAADGIAVQVDHLVPDEVRALVTRIEGEQGRLHVLVNDICGATKIEWNKSVWESTLDYGLRTLRLAVDTHAITSHFAIPLLIKVPGGLVVEVNDGTAEYNEVNYRNSLLLRPGQGGGAPNGVCTGARVEASRRNGRVTHSGLAAIGGHARGVRRHRIELA